MRILRNSVQKIAGFQVIVLSMILQESVGYRGVEKGGREQTVRLESEHGKRTERWKVRKLFTSP